MNFDILRQKILEKAIRGELVPQLESEPEVVQIDRCLANAPFSIPKKWRWAYFSDVIDLISGRDLEKDKILTVNNGIPYITGASQIQDGNIIVNRWTEHPIVVSKKGDILLTCKGTIGKIAQNNIGEIHIARQIMAIRPSEKISIGYITYFLYYVKNFLVEKAKSMIPGIDRKTLLSMPIPLPPIEEQHRITIRLEGLFKDLSCAEKSFADLLTFTKIIKNRVLNKAIRGRLVPQLESEPPVEQIGKLIDKIPFPIPCKWKWIQLKHATTKITDGTHHSPPSFNKGDFLYITAKNIKSSGVDLANVTYVSKNIHEEIFKRCNPEPGDVLFIKDGATTGVVTINNLENPFSLLSSVALLKVKREILLPEFLIHVLRSQYTRDLVARQMQGTGIPRVTLKKLKELWIPIPPLNEQYRISIKLQNLIATIPCEN